MENKTTPTGVRWHITNDHAVTAQDLAYLNENLDIVTKYCCCHSGNYTFPAVDKGLVTGVVYDSSCYNDDECFDVCATVDIKRANNDCTCTISWKPLLVYVKTHRHLDANRITDEILAYLNANLNIVQDYNNCHGNDAYNENFPCEFKERGQVTHVDYRDCRTNPEWPHQCSHECVDLVEAETKRDSYTIQWKKLLAYVEARDDSCPPPVLK